MAQVRLSYEKKTRGRNSRLTVPLTCSKSCQMCFLCEAWSPQEYCIYIYILILSFASSRGCDEKGSYFQFFLFGDEVRAAGINPAALQ